MHRSEFVVDAETHLPREHRLVVRAPNDMTLGVRWHYLVYERLPLNDETCSPGTDKLIRRGPLGFPNPCAR